MKIIPNTLLARLILTISLLLIISQFFTIKIFDYFERGPRADALAQEVVAIVKYTKTSIETAAPEKRVQLLQNFSNMSDVRIFPSYYFESIKPLPNDTFLKLVVKKIQDNLGQDTIVTLNHYDIPGIWVSFEIGYNLFWVVIPRNIIDRPFPWHWIGWGIVIFFTTLSGAYFLTERINRPLDLLIRATDILKRGGQFEKLPTDSVNEFKKVTQSFNKMAESLAQAENERKFIMGSVSHDIRTPLTRLKLSLEMLPKKLTDLKDSMDQDIEEINQIINQFLDFVRGFNHEKKEPVNIGDLLISIQKQHERSGQKVKVKKITHSKEVPEKLYIDLRPFAFRRMINNLINNAHQYSEKKPIELKAELNNENLIIRIQDDGPGIPKNMIKKIMQPFERLNDARSNIGGSGLGLAIANRIADSHNAKLELINRKKGLEVKITIPLHQT
jgi:two-component system osmolarity sensor histidine kinase EnvZ